MRELLSPAELLKFFEKHPAKTFRLRQLMAELGLRSSQARDLKGALQRLAGARKIVHLKQNQFVLAKQFPSKDMVTSGSRSGKPNQYSRELPGGTMGKRGANVITGRLIGHRDGYGFVVPDAGGKSTAQDIFIPPGEMASAMHGDRVEVLIVRAKRDGRLEGRIHRVLDRAQKTVVGEFHYGARYNYVAPFDMRITREIVIPQGQEWPDEAQEITSRNRQFGGESEGKRGVGRAAHERSDRELENLIVDVEITSFAQPGSLGNPRGRVLEILGRRDDFGVDVEIMIRKFHLPHRFPVEVLAQAADQ